MSKNGESEGIQNNKWYKLMRGLKELGCRVKITLRNPSPIQTPSGKIAYCDTNGLITICIAEMDDKTAIIDVEDIIMVEHSRI